MMVNGEFDIIRFLVVFMMSAILTFLFLKAVLYLNKNSKSKQIDKLLLENIDLKIHIEKQATMIFRLESENKILKLSEENKEINKHVNL